MRLDVRSPADGIRVPNSSITVTGTVSPPRAAVLVLGRPAAVQRDGSFSARVSLSAGVNLIDVLASLPHASGAMTALRVERYVLVAVPQVVGLSPRAAAAAVRAAGLVPKLQPGGNPLSFLAPLPNQVCSASPPPGVEVSPGSTVTLVTSNLCQGPSPPAQSFPGPGNGGHGHGDHGHGGGDNGKGG